MEFHCWGISHKSTSLEVREKFAFNKEKIDEIIANLKSHTPFDNGIFLSTCNRTEFYSFCKRTDIKVFDAYLENLTGKNIHLRKNDQYLFSNNEAFKHLLRVMTGIDSMIVGEPDIFGQVKKSFQNSKEFQYLDTDLEIIFNRSINFSNRSQIKIENIESHPLEELNSNISDFQIIVIAASADSPLFDLNNVTEGTVIFDLAIPRNLTEDQNNKEISILTLDAICEMVKANLKGREEAVKLAEDLIIKNADSEFSKLKNRKNINNVQKKFHEDQNQIKDIAVQNAL